MKYFEAKQNLPGGIKRGDIVTTERKVTRNDKGEIVKYVPEAEPDFFLPVTPLPAIYKKQAEVMVKIKQKVARPVPTSRFKKEYDTVPPFAPLRITNIYLKELAGSKKKVTVYELFYLDGNLTFELPEAILFPYQKYYFLNSKGTIQSMPIGQDREADAFRLAVGNYFETNQEASDYRQGVLKRIQDGIMQKAQLTE